MDIDTKIAEVIATGSTEFSAQCYKLNESPSLGALVKTGQENDFAVYGVVYHVETHSMEEGRRVLVRGEKMSDVSEVFKNNPHLEKLLVTDFKVVVLGYRENKKLFHYLPPQPARMHGFVFVCGGEEVKEFSQSLNFLSTLTESNLPVSGDEIVAASLRYMSKNHDNPQDFLVKAGRELVWMLGGDIRRLNTILKRLEVG
jgi:hypothetical protein